MLHCDWPGPFLFLILIDGLDEQARGYVEDAGPDPHVQTGPPLPGRNKKLFRRGQINS